MIDIHTHVLPGVDDGSQSMEMSLEMLALAADSGVEALVTTPHCNIPDEYENYASEQMLSLWERLDRARKAEGIPVKLYRGMEIFATAELPELLLSRRVWTLNDTSYFLTEFAFDEDPLFCYDVLARCKKLGFHPVIAHPERYYFIQDDPQIAYDFCTDGCALQINKGSVLGRFGPDAMDTAHLLLQHGLCACLASDAHSPQQRSTFMTEILDVVSEEFGSSYAQLLLHENPARILSGRKLLGYEPIPI